MRNYFNFLLTSLFLCSSLLKAEDSHSKKGSFYFTENKGQISDQNYKPRPDVLFSATDGQLVFHLKNNGISYQQYRIDKWEEEPDYRFPSFKKMKMRKVPTQQTIYRLDVEWLNCNSNCVIEKSIQKDGYENYYMGGCPTGALEARSYQQLIYKEIYSGIDLKLYQKNNHLKYDYIVSPGADYKNIQLIYSGAEKLTINKNGELIITTPLGDIIEQAPFVTQKNKVLKSAWKINKNTASFSIENYDLSLPFTIDPGVRIWATYYGGTGGEAATRSVVDAAGNVYTTGNTNTVGGTVIATIGGHQTAYGGGADNGFLVKFNSAGVRQWGTYYGGPVREFGISCALDLTGNIYMCGHSLSNTPGVVATPGAHQTVNGGVFDAYLVKFNSAGVRQWGTYYGDSGTDFGMSCATDANGNVYLAGKTNASTGTIIATVGSHQPVFGGDEDAFLVQFNSNGVRQWATHYGGPGLDNAYFCTTDAAGNIFMSGYTNNTVAGIIETPGAYQTTFGGGALDAFIVKFNTNGVRQLGTYYGGSGEDDGFGCAVDANGFYLTGETNSPNAIASPSCQQTFFGGGTFDGFIARFDNNLQRRWGTYYGSTAEDVGYGCYIHATGHIYMAGYSTSPTTTLIATPGSFQTTFGGGMYDAFIAQFDTAGARTWGSYYGDTGDDIGYTCSTDNVYNVYLTGATTSSGGTLIATPLSHQPLYGGGSGDGFVVKFYDCPAPLAPTNTTSASNLNFCAGASSTLHVNSVGTVNWYATPSSTLSLGTGTTFVTPILFAGVITFYAEANTCTLSATRTAITITVNPTPNLNITSSTTLVCAGKNATLNVSGASTYTWDNSSTTSSNVVTPITNTIYTVSGTSTLNCIGTNTISITVYPPDVVTLVPSSYTSCLSIFGGGPITLTGTPTGGTYSGPNVNGNSLNPTAIGVFSPVYTFTNSVNGCVNTASTTITVVSCLGIKENTFLNSVAIYPNPTKGMLTIETNSDSEKTISITDVAGKILKTEITKNKIYTVNISEYSNGIYFVKLKSGSSYKEFKLIKE